MIRPQLGEDADHRAAEKVAGLGISAGRQGLLKQLEGAFRVVLVQSLKGGSERVVPGEHQLRTRRQAVGHEVARARLQHVQRLLELAALQQQPPERAPGLGVAGVELERAA